MADRVAAGLSCYRGKRRLLRCGGWEGEQVSAVSAGRRRHDQHGNPAGDRVDRDDSLFPLGSGPLYLGWDLFTVPPCYLGGLPSVELVRQSVSSIRIGRRCYQIG